MKKSFQEDSDMYSVVTKHGFNWGRSEFLKSSILESRSIFGNPTPESFCKGLLTLWKFPPKSPVLVTKGKLFEWSEFFAPCGGPERGGFGGKFLVSDSAAPNLLCEPQSLLPRHFFSPGFPANFPIPWEVTLETSLLFGVRKRKYTKWQIWGTMSLGSMISGDRGKDWLWQHQMFESNMFKSNMPSGV